MNMTDNTDNVGASSAFSRLLGLEILQVGGGEARVRLTLTDELRNLHAGNAADGRYLQPLQG